MILKLEELQDACKKILSALDTTSNSGDYGDILEMCTEDDYLKLSVSNGEYYVTVKLKLENVTDTLHTVVNAGMFLNLISKVTTKDVELVSTENYLAIKANGNYKIPMLYVNDKLKELPKIDKGEVTSEFKISNANLQDVVKYNTKELQKSGIKNFIQRMFYIDQEGCITFTSGACVNSFSLEKPISMLLSEKVVKLFKLFKDTDVDFSMSFNQLSSGILQNIVTFKDSTVEIISILNSDTTLINKVPVKAIRQTATNDYPFVASIFKTDLLGAIDRLSIFNEKNGRKLSTLYTYFKFSEGKLTIYDSYRENSETINLTPDSKVTDYELLLNTDDLKLTIESCDEQYIVIRFGSRAVVFDRQINIKNILPECVDVGE